MLVWIAVAVGVALAAALLLALYATQLEPYRPLLRRIAVPVPADWPALSILHLSDLHVRTSNPRLADAQARFLRGIVGTRTWSA